MIFRRISEHVKAQNWTAIGIDFVIVVVGVFIGIQLGNWNATLADKRLAADYVERLISDLEDNRVILTAQITYYEAVLDSVERTDALLQDPNADPRELVINAYRASEISYTAPVRATWDEIIAAGDVGLLPRSAVQSGLMQYYAFDTTQDIYFGGLDSTYRAAVRETIPLNVQVAMRNGCSDVRDPLGNIAGFTTECRLDVTPELIAETADALRANPRVAETLRTQYSFAISGVLNLSGSRSGLDMALTALGAPPEAGTP